MRSDNLEVFAFSEWSDPYLHVWRDWTQKSQSTLAYDEEPAMTPSPNWFRFAVPVDRHIHEHLHCKLHTDGNWEPVERTVDRINKRYEFPNKIWIVKGASRILLEDPKSADVAGRVRVHLVTAKKYRDGKLHLWIPGRPGRDIEKTKDDKHGPYFDIDLSEEEKHFFVFRFHVDGDWEDECFNKLWCAADGPEIWVHSRATHISQKAPAKHRLVIHAYGMSTPEASPLLHLWQEESDFDVNITGSPEADGWFVYEYLLYSGRPYGFMLFNPDWGRHPWEHDEARRQVTISRKTEYWTFHGDHALFTSKPTPDVEIMLEVSAVPPFSPLAGKELEMDAWINQGDVPLAVALSPENGVWTFRTYRNIVTSFKFRYGSISEEIPRHYIRCQDPKVGRIQRWVVINKADVLERPPVDDLYRDPPFWITRPGAWVDGDRLHFALHSPSTAAAEVIGDFTKWRSKPIPMRSTLDGTYFWADIPLSDVNTACDDDFHGVYYKYLLNNVLEVQDPAADWVENSSPQSASRLVDHARYNWSSNNWRRPGWEYLTVYQLHVSRFSRRTWDDGTALNAFDHVRKEIEEATGYLRNLGCTALLLLPVCEFSGDRSWGYGVSFFWAPESFYGGPDSLKALVDSCHRQGIAVILDVVFNHAGTSDNALWAVSRDTVFEGDTRWGAMVNFDHPQVKHFFSSNLEYFMHQYRIDGFRFDATRAIRKSDELSDIIIRKGSGGGWEFMQALREAVQRVDSKAIMIAEDLDNCWSLTHDGPMDSQWYPFYSSLIEACGSSSVSPLAEALKVTQTKDLAWHEAMNCESTHDEVGHHPHRIAQVGGTGKGLRLAKVAGAATLLGRGIPMHFMGEESGMWAQFNENTDDPLDIPGAVSDPSACAIRKWWHDIQGLRCCNPKISGAAPIDVCFAQDGMVAFSRGSIQEYFVVLNFTEEKRGYPLSWLNLPGGTYKELTNSTWPDYKIPVEGETYTLDTGGWDSRLQNWNHLNIPAYSVVVLERAE